MGWKNWWNFQRIIKRGKAKYSYFNFGNPFKFFIILKLLLSRSKFKINSQVNLNHFYLQNYSSKFVINANSKRHNMKKLKAQIISTYSSHLQEENWYSSTLSDVILRTFFTFNSFRRFSPAAACDGFRQGWSLNLKGPLDHPVHLVHHIVFANCNQYLFCFVSYREKVTTHVLFFTKQI